MQVRAVGGAIELDDDDEEDQYQEYEEEDEGTGEDGIESDEPETELEASERLARELMEAEEREFLQRLHEEQQRALDQMRSTGAVGNEAWMEESDGEGGEAEGSRELDYDELLELGERLGDVKTERWREKSAQVAGQLPRITFVNMRRTLPMYKDELCVICQFDFDGDDELKLMPNCTHAFHTDCADAWIKDHDRCATCKAALE